jgi:hypothetical protein
MPVTKIFGALTMPDEINPETLDYLRIQLEGEIRANVETALFRYYRNLGSAILTVLGLVGVLGLWALKVTVQDEVGLQVSKQVSKPVDDALESVNAKEKKIAETLITTDARLEQAQTAALKMERNLDVINATMTKDEQNLLNLEENVNSNSSSVTANVARMEALGNKYASYGAVDTLTQQLAALSNQVNSINKALNQLAQAAGRTNAIIDARGVSDAVAAIQKQAMFVAASDGDSRTTVFVQYWESTRPEIDRLTKMLSEDGTFQIPGEEKVATADGKHEIRYFYKEDEAAAKELKSKTESALSDLGYQPVSIDTKPLLSFPAKPRHKVIELWLELPKKK